MDKMRIAENTSTKFVLEKSLATSDIWRGWSKSLILPLLFLAGSSIALFTGFLQTWWVWVILVGALIVEAFTLYLFLASEQKITITIDLHSKIAARVEKLIGGKVKKTELELDQVDRILLHSEEVGHHTRLLLEAQSHPPLEIANNYDLLTLDQGRYVYNQTTEGVSEIKSLDMLAKKIGEFLQKPVVGKLTDQGNLISEEVMQP